MRDDSAAGLVPPADAWHLADLVGACYVEVAAIAGDAARPHGLTLGELVALAILAQQPDGVSQSAWARLQGVTRQRAHVVTRSMEAKGLVRGERRGRESVVRFTAEGRRTTERLRESIGTVLADTMAGLTPAQLQDTAELLTGLLGSLRAGNTDSFAEPTRLRDR
jgi:DNA-binding MarR family transcriptional regulator